MKENVLVYSKTTESIFQQYEQGLGVGSYHPLSETAPTQSPREGLCPMWRKTCELHLPSWARTIAPPMQYSNTLSPSRDNSSWMSFLGTRVGAFIPPLQCIGQKRASCHSSGHLWASRNHFSTRGWLETGLFLFVCFTLFCPTFYSREGDRCAVKACCHRRAVESQGICLVSFWLACSSGKRMMQYFCLNWKRACPEQDTFCLGCIQLDVTLPNLSLSMKTKCSWLEDFVLSCQRVHGLNSHTPYLFS